MKIENRVFEASAPGRAGIIGNPSDIYGGLVVSCSVPLRNRCILTESESELPQEKGADTRLFDAAIRRFRALGHDIDASKLEVKWESDVPRSSGLSGSTASLASLVLCLRKLTGGDSHLATIQSRIEFAEFVRDIERHDADIVCGYQDAYMICLGGMQAMDFTGKHPETPGKTAQVKSIESKLPFLLVTTGVERLSGSVHGPLAKRWLAGEVEVVKGMQRITELGRDGYRAILSEDWSQLADLMNENQRIIASVGGSGDAIDALITQALSGGAKAAKLAGAGMGGTIICLGDDLENLQENLSKLGYTKFIRPRLVPGVSLEPGSGI